MFFINSDLNKANSQKSLNQVINDESVKVAYGVLSLENFYKMVKHMQGLDKIYIPKVQRGLVWKSEGKEEFIKNCITGTDGVQEPMPNIFLFCDEDTKDIQLFDGLQRTAAILGRFENVNEITKNMNVMIPAALFKGTREEAENLFRHINDKGVKLNDFEKLASFGGQYEINFDKLDEDFKDKFNEFIDKSVSPYKKIGLLPSEKEKTTIYEILTYAIHSFSSTVNARKIFKMSDKELVSEWGFQIAYSTTTNAEKKVYTKNNMLKSLLGDFAKKIDYNKDTKFFDVKKLEEYIDNVTKSINNTYDSLKNIFERNLTTRITKKTSEGSMCQAALKSEALIGSVVSAYYYHGDIISRSFIRKWFLLQLISNRASQNTNKIIDDLFDDIKEKNEKDIDASIKNKINSLINDEPNQNQYSKWLWVLYYLHIEQLTDSDLTTEYEIDHIVPQKSLKNLKIDRKKINNIGNLMLINKEINRQKSDEHISTFIEPVDSDMMSKFICLNKQEKNEFSNLLNIDEEIYQSIENKEYSTAKTSYDSLITKRIVFMKRILNK
ncbi:MAG: DUF1524 domain-containing protein [Mycoplasmataceae bacterium]|nr:DUF1524 domain-containing protein [Mycoplasmataceae bacterium]